LDSVRKFLDGSTRGLLCAGMALGAMSLSACGQRPETPPSPVAQTAAAPAFVVQGANVRAMTPAFGQVDSADAVSARARIGGTISDLRVREGDRVERGQVLAIVDDARVPLQAQAETARASALQAQVAQARADLQRVEKLHADGFYPTQRLEQQQAALAVLENQLKAARAQRAVTVETGAQGAVLAPVDGAVLRLPVRRGGVVMMGEEIALVGSTYIVKLKLPERHAAMLAPDEIVEVETTASTRQVGRVKRIYPALEEGRVEADIETEGLQKRVFGERIRVWIPAGQRAAIVVPASLLVNRYGVDFARVRLPDGSVQDVVVRRGEPVSAEGIESAVEVHSGLRPGDQLVAPVGVAAATTP
jgi:RND family efflux transporter MFP subunit